MTIFLSFYKISECDLNVLAIWKCEWLNFVFFNVVCRRSSLHYSFAKCVVIQFGLGLVLYMQFLLKISVKFKTSQWLNGGTIFTLKPV